MRFERSFNLRRGLRPMINKNHPGKSSTEKASTVGSEGENPNKEKSKPQKERAHTDQDINQLLQNLTQNHGSQ